jgi:hypothetical protein
MRVTVSGCATTLVEMLADDDDSDGNEDSDEDEEDRRAWLTGDNGGCDWCC